VSTSGKYIRIDKREARRLYDTGRPIVMSLDKPSCPMGERVEFSGITTVQKGQTKESFDKLVTDALEWKHRYPGSQGLVWYTPAPPPLTPFDTGKRAEPRVWPTSEEGVTYSPTRYGKVDFDAEDGFTLATLYIERDEDGSYTLRGYANVPLKIDVEDQS
jgi:hypothetical protein